MPDPQAGSFQQRTPKSPPVQVGERLEIRLTPEAERDLRIQCLERAISQIPIIGQNYANELRRLGLQKLDLKLPWPTQ